MMLDVGSALGVFIGGVSFGFAGFAFALFATSALSLASPPQVVVPVAMLLSDTLALPLLWEHRRYLGEHRLREAPPFARWSAVPLVVGVVLGTILLGGVTPVVGRLALAGVILAFVGLQAARPLGRAPSRGEVGPAPAGAGAGAALLGGFMDGWLSTGGVVMALYLTWRRFAPGVFVAAILVYFLVTDFLRVISYTAFGHWSSATAELYLRALPMALAGYAAGVVLRRFVLPAAAFRAGVLLILSVYGFALIGRVLLAP